ncbi:MAG TPA: hypothetical protein VK588_13070 [Chitinophagaceae bacterium]|nr:hypothetical protein [Chitinophagaceae bacterium]
MLIILKETTGTCHGTRHKELAWQGGNKIAGRSKIFLTSRQNKKPFTGFHQ